MSSSPITSVFNDGYITDVYDAYRRDPASVDESWRQFFRFAEAIGGAGQAGTSATADPGLLRKVAGAAALVDAIRQYGHLAVQIDPLGLPPHGAPELSAEFHGITDADLTLVPGAALGFADATAADVVARLRAAYSSTMAFEVEHLGGEAERQWFRQMIEQNGLQRALTPGEKRALLQRLSEVDGLERFLGIAYKGAKRFSIEGTDALVPMIDEAIARAGASGTREIVIGMAHRGRLNVLTHILGKPYATLFAEFEGKHAKANSESDTGDVKYHMGLRGSRRVASGAEVALELVPNPSHLEFVNPVINGVARAHQRVPGAAPGTLDEARVLAICVHGDAAFIGEGVVAETFNMSQLRGYRVGGTLHIIANNQVGFTTDPVDARSTHYASDLAKGFEVPIVHVNGDDAEACIAAVRLGIEYRTRFGKDFLVDLVGYRRHGHNETDEPAFTQPALYQRIRSHPSPREVWGARLVSEGVVTAQDVEQMAAAISTRLSSTHDEVKASLAGEREEHDSPEGPAAPPPTAVATAVGREKLAALNEQLLAWPAAFKVHPTLLRTLPRRRDALEQGIDWGHAEALAFASLLTEGTSIRLSGQDVERGTFSHRQAVLHDAENGDVYTPLQHLPQASGTAEIYNSPLTETAVMGFEYGFSVAAGDALVLWEAQFGDFVNVAMPIIDQFIAADRAKWGQDSGIVLLLPHGYEGQGPEHSSARLERFLQLCADGNMRVAYPSTPAQYFHILRRQAKLTPRRPLVLMQPKSMLRLKEAASGIGDLAAGGFQPVIDDAVAARRREAVRRLVLCTGKIYHDLAARAEGSGNGESSGTADAHRGDVALVRVEELYPWPHEEVARIVDAYPAIEDVVWAQEEPKNMGAWTYVAPRLRASTGNSMTIRYVGRPERASPAEGYKTAHELEQERILAEVLEVPQPSARRRGGPGVAAKS